MHFCQQRKHHPEPLLYLNNEPIQVVKETKTANFLPHIKYPKAKCLKALNLLRVVDHTDWGADYTALMRIYTSCIRSKLDYGSIVYGFGKNHIFKFMSQYTIRHYDYVLVLIVHLHVQAFTLKLMNFLLISEGKSCL